MSVSASLQALFGHAHRQTGTQAVLSWVERHHTGLAAFGIVLFLFVYQVYLHPLYFSKSRQLPGPGYGNWLFGQFGEIIKREAGLVQSEWADEYAKDGKVVRAVGPFGIERLIFLTPKAYEQILTTDVYDFPRPDFTRNVLGEVTGHGLLTVEGDDHRVMRKMMSPAFSGAHLSQLVDLFYPPLEILQKILNKRIEEGEKESGEEGGGAILDMYELMSHCTLDIICETAFGYSPNSLEHPENELAEAYEDLLALQSGGNLVLLILASTLPGGMAFTHFISKTLPRWASGTLGQFDDAMVRIKAVSKKLLKSKTGDMTGEEAVQGKDVLSLLVAANKGEDGQEYLNESQMMDQVLTFLGAGHETTATGMSWTLWLLANHPEVQQKLQDECADMMARRIDPDMEMLNSLPYLNAVVHESLRVMPPVPMTFRKARVDKVVDGVFVPKGTILYIGNRTVNTLPSLWGEDAREFRPERWLEEDKEGHEKHNMYSFMSFIHGAHSCIGARMATLEMKAMVLVIMANYRFEKSTKDQTVTPTAAITMKPTDGLPLRVRRVKTFANALT